MNSKFDSADFDLNSSQNFFVLREYVLGNIKNDSDGEWTEAVLFISYNTEQILLYENAESIALRTFFRMARLNFQLEQRLNAEFMSPTGKIPFLKLQKNLIAEFSPVVKFVAKKGIELSFILTDSEKADLQAYIALIEEILKNAEIYFIWTDKETYYQITKKRYAKGFLWPLTLWMPALKQNLIIEYLKNIGWYNKKPEEVIKLCEKCFYALSIKLGKNNFFFGDQPTELDALAFGHFYSIITTNLPDKRLVNLLSKYENLISFTERVDNEYFFK